MESTTSKDSKNWTWECRSGVYHHSLDMENTQKMFVVVTVILWLTFFVFSLVDWLSLPQMLLTHWLWSHARLSCKTVTLAHMLSNFHLLSCPSFLAELRNVCTWNLLFFTSLAGLNPRQSVFHLSCPKKATSLRLSMNPVAKFYRYFSVHILHNLSEAAYNVDTSPSPLKEAFSLGFHNPKHPSCFCLSGCSLRVLSTDSISSTHH